VDKLQNSFFITTVIIIYIMTLCARKAPEQDIVLVASAGVSVCVCLFHEIPKRTTVT